MPPIKDTGPPVPGTLRVVVIKANNLRANGAGRLSSPMVRLRMRAIANPRAQDAPHFETSTLSSNCDPEWEEEFHMPVKDANQSQLEVTIWDSGESEASPAPFMGECILNLSKLVPYQGEIIMQDFDVKQGKQHKTQVQASGKLILQLEFTGGDFVPPPRADPAPLPIEAAAAQSQPMQSPAVALLPGQEQFVMNIVLVQARDLGKNMTSDPDSYVCATLLDDPASMETRHFHALDHGVGQITREIIVLTPQHRTKIAPASLFPQWGDGCTLSHAHPSVRLVEQAQMAAEAEADKVPLVGQPVLLMFTVHNHTADCGGQNGFLGRVVLPQIRAGQPVDQWFVLQTLEGKELLGASGKPSGLRVQIYYGPAAQIQNIGAPYTIPHQVPTALALPPAPNLAPSHVPSSPEAPIASAAPTLAPTQEVAIVPTADGDGKPPVAPLALNALMEHNVRAQTPDQNWARPSTPQIIQTFAGSQFAFYLEVVEARNLPTQVAPAGGVMSEAYACISLLQDPASMDKHHFFLIDHHLTDEAPDARFLQFLPQHTTKSLSGANPAWSDACTLKGTHPDIKTILELKSREKLASSSETVQLAGQTVLLLATVHDKNASNGSTLRGRVVIPQVRAGQPVDQWFMLHCRDGSQVKDEFGQDAAIRLRFAYGAVKEDAAQLPAGWEQKTDEASGKTFYVNHQLKTFSWVPPPRAATPTKASIGLPLPHHQTGCPGPPGAGPVGDPLEGASQALRATVEATAAPMIQPAPQAIADTGHKSPAPERAGVCRDLPASQGSTATKIKMSIQEGKDLPRMDHLSLSNAYVCISLIGHADKIDDAARARLLHDVSKNKLRAGLRSSMLKLHPLYKTQVVNRSLNPKWMEDVEFSEGYLSLEAIEALQQKGAPKEGGKTALGSGVLVFITVHHEVSGAEDTAIGRILVPALQPGEQLDDWFPLLDKDGAPLMGGMSEKPSQIRVQMTYEAGGATNGVAEAAAARQVQEQEQRRLDEEAQEHERVRLQEEHALLQEEQERSRLQGEHALLDAQRQHDEARRQHEEEEAREAERVRYELALEEAQRQREQLTRAAVEAQGLREEDEAHQRSIAEEHEDQRQRAYMEQQRIQAEAEKQMQAEAQERQAKARRNDALPLGVPAVGMQLKLGLDFAAAGHHATPTRTAFEQNLLRDLCNSSGAHPACFRITQMSPGSVIVNAEIHADPSGRGPAPEQIAANLERQAQDASSPLRRGNLTCYIEGIAFNVLSDTAARWPDHKALPAVYPPRPSLHQAKLIVEVVQAKNLPHTDGESGGGRGGCHTFCELALLSSVQQGQLEVPIARTGASANGSCNPIWNEQFISGVDAEQMMLSNLKLSLYEWNPTMPHRLLGRIRHLRLSDIVTQGKSKTWLDLFTEDGLPLGNGDGQASLCLALQYEVPFVQASVNVSPPLSANSLASVSNPRPMNDAVPLITMNADLPCVHTTARVSSQSPPRNRAQVKDTYPLMTLHTSAIFTDKGEAPAIESPANSPPGMQQARGRSRQGSLSPTSFAANNQPRMPTSPEGTPTIHPATNLHSPTFGPLDSPRGYSNPKMVEAGVGIHLLLGRRSEYVVDSLLPGGPAAHSNQICIGDELLDVDGYAIAGKPMSEVQRMLAGEAHSPVTMTFSRSVGSPSANAPVQKIVTLCRKKLSRANTDLPKAALPAAARGLPLSMVSGAVPGGEMEIVVAHRPMAVRSAAPRSPPKDNNDTIPLHPLLPPKGEGERGGGGGTNFFSEANVRSEAPPLPDVHTRPSSPSVSMASSSSRTNSRDWSRYDNSAAQAQAADEARRRAEELRRKEMEAVNRQLRPSDPFAHLKTEFGALMNDLYGSKNDPDMTAALVWKKKLLYGTAQIISPPRPS